MKYRYLFFIIVSFALTGHAYDDPTCTSVGYSPRGRALGNAAFAHTMGSESVFYNPATYRHTDSIDLYCSYFKQYDLVDYGTITAALPYNTLMGISYSADGLYSEYVIKASYVFPQKVYEFMYIAASMSVLYAATEPAQETGGNVEGSGIGLSPEIAIFCPVSDTFAVSMQLRDIGGFMRWNTRAAEGYDAESKGIYAHMRTMDVINGYYYKPHKNVGISFFHRNFSSFGVGTEYTYKDMVSGRLGYTRYMEDEVTQKVTFGIGAVYQKYRVDIAYEINSFQSMMLVGLGIVF